MSKESKRKCVLSLPYPPPRRSSHVSGHRCCLPPVGGLQVTGERAEGSVLPQSTGSHNRCIIGPGRCLPPSQYPLPHHLMPLHLVSVETFSTIRGDSPLENTHKKFLLFRYGDSFTSSSKNRNTQGRAKSKLSKHGLSRS